MADEEDSSTTSGQNWDELVITEWKRKEKNGKNTADATANPTPSKREDLEGKGHRLLSAKSHGRR